MNKTIKISSGQTLSQIVQQQYGLKGWDNIYNKCLEVKQANNSIFDINKIKAETTIVLPDVPEDNETPKAAVTDPENSKKTSEVQEEPDAQKTSSPEIANQPQTSNLGVVDKWYVDTAVNTQLAKDDAHAQIFAYSEAHPNYKSSDLADIGTELNTKLSSIEDNGVNLIKPDDVKAFSNGTMTVNDVYHNGLVSAAKDSIKSVKDLDGDANTMNREEFEAQQKEIQTQITFNRMDRSNKEHTSNNLVSYDEFESYYNTTHPYEFGVPNDIKEKFQALAKDKGGIDLNDVSSNPEMFGVQYDKAATDRAFDAIDLDVNGKIDYKEQASVYAAMDSLDQRRGIDGTKKGGRDGIIQSPGAELINQNLGLYKNDSGVQGGSEQDLSDLKNLFGLYRPNFEKY